MLKMSEIDDGNFNTTLAKLKAKPAMGMTMLLVKRSGLHSRDITFILQLL